MPKKAGLEIHAGLKALRKELREANDQFRQFNKDAVKSATGIKTVEESSNRAAKSVGFMRRTFDGFRNMLNSSIARLGAAFGIGAWAREIIGASSALQELDSKARVVFGDLFPQVERQVRSIADEVGRARSQMLQFSADMGAVIDAAGLSKERMSEMSTELAKLSIDLASFHNTADIEAFNALRSAITGELEPLKRFGVVMTQDNLAAFALTKGIKQKISAMNQAQLTAIRYAYILDRTTTAQGDAARTADSFANQTRRLQGEWQALNEELGKAATPKLAEGLAFINDFLRNIFIPAIRIAATEFRSLLNLIAGTGFGQKVGGNFEKIFGGSPSDVWGLLTGKSKQITNYQRDLSIEDVRAAVAAGSNTPLAGSAASSANLADEIASLGGGATKPGGGGKSKAEETLKEIEKLEGEILKALGDQAKVNLDNLRMKREDLLLREKLGILTKQESRELERINNRLEFSDEKIDGMVQKWEDLQQAIKSSGDRLKDLRQELKDMDEDLRSSLSDIDANAADERLRKITELVRERNQLVGNSNSALGGGLTGDESYRLGQINDELAGATPEELARAQELAGQNGLSTISGDAEAEKQRLIDEEKQKRGEILDQIRQERELMDDLKMQSKDAQQEIVQAVEERYARTVEIQTLELEATKSYVDEMIAQYNRLTAVTGMGAAGGNTTIINNSSNSNTVNQNNYGEAARAATDPRAIQWQMDKRS